MAATEAGGDAEKALKALVEQERLPWEEASQKKAVEEARVESADWVSHPDDSAPYPSTREKRSKGTHDPAWQAEVDTQADEEARADASTTDAAKGREQGTDDASEGPDDAPKGPDVAPPAAEVLLSETKALDGKADDGSDPVTKAGDGAPEAKTPAMKDPARPIRQRCRLGQAFRSWAIIVLVRSSTAAGAGTGSKTQPLEP